MAGLVVTALLTVVVHNTAGVQDETVNRARLVVERIYADCGVVIAWNTTAGERFPAVVRVTVRRQPGGGPGAGSPAALGTTLGGDHTHGGTTFVYYERVLKLSHRYGQPVDVILALAIAHELGHVLLPVPAHASSGLMKAEWDGDDIRRLTLAGATFSREQAAAIAATVEGYRSSAAKPLCLVAEPYRCSGAK